MNKTYMMRFFTKDIQNGEDYDEHEIARYSDNKYIPVPTIGSTVVLEDYDDLYEVTNIDYCYPFTGTEVKEYEIDVTVRKKAML